jgi:hypothetical protein
MVVGATTVMDTRDLIQASGVWGSGWLVLDRGIYCSHGTVTVADGGTAAGTLTTCRGAETCIIHPTLDAMASKLLFDPLWLLWTNLCRRHCHQADPGSETVGSQASQRAVEALGVVCACLLLQLMLDLTWMNMLCFVPREHEMRRGLHSR